MKKILVLVVGFLLLCLVVSCSGKTTNIVSLKEVSAKQDEKLNEHLLSLIDDGIYLFETKERLYVVFNCIKESYENIELELSDTILNVNFTTDTLSEQKQIVLEIVPFPSNIYDTILLNKNGVGIAFNARVLF